MKVTKLGIELKKMMKGADELYIVTALMTEYGLNFILKNTPKKCNITLLIGIDLPTQYEVLKRLKDDKSRKINARVYMQPDQYFHANVYISVHGTETRGIVGSGNCTEGGLTGNIEMSLKNSDTQTAKDLLTWFHKNYTLGEAIRYAWLSEYENIYKSRKKTEVIDQAIISDFASGVLAQHRPKNLSHYIYKGQFFKYKHYNSFTKDKPKRNSKQIREERAKVRDKLLELHAMLMPQIEAAGWNLWPHHRQGSTVSSISRSSEMHWVWLHYGRSKDELKALNKMYGDSKKPVDNMQLEVLVSKSNLAVWLCVGNDGGSVTDRLWIKKHMLSEGYRNRLFELITGLPKGYFIKIAGVVKYADQFKSPDELCSFILRDKIGENYFIIGIEYAPNDIRISKDQIVQTILADFRLLMPLYLLIKTKTNSKQDSIEDE